MAVSTPNWDDPNPKDHLTPLLERCAIPAQSDTPALKKAFVTSCKLDLRAIQEVEAMEGYATDEDFDELLFMPKVQDFLAQPRHDDLMTKTFWLLLRMRYLGMLPRPQRAQVVKFNERFCYQPASLLVEFYKLSTVPERLRLLSHLSYFDFAAFIAESDRRALPLHADNSVFLRSMDGNQPNTKTRRSFNGSFLAR